MRACNECNKPHHAFGLCYEHWEKDANARQRRGYKYTLLRCRYCKKYAVSKGFCEFHYNHHFNKGIARPYWRAYGENILERRMKTLKKCRERLTREICFARQQNKLQKELIKQRQERKERYKQILKLPLKQVAEKFLTSKTAEAFIYDGVLLDKREKELKGDAI